MRTRPFTSPGDPVGGTHRSVLLHEAVDAIVLRRSGIYVDATYGGGGHTRLIREQAGREATIIAIDADQSAIARATEAAQRDPRLIPIHANFRRLDVELRARDIQEVTGVLFDLGWSGFQLTAGRGFSFQSDEPLHMGYDEAQELTAATVVNTWAETSLADVIYGWGGERYARKIARGIVEARAKNPIRTAYQLAHIVSRAVPAAYRRGRTHPATKTFQAIRIAVNDELGALGDGLRGAWSVLTEGGRLAVVTFHSLEDRAVKQLFRSWAKEGAMLLTKKPITPNRDEIRENPRARSAKLRVIEKHVSYEKKTTENQQVPPLDPSGEA